MSALAEKSARLPGAAPAPSARAPQTAAARPAGGPAQTAAAALALSLHAAVLAQPTAAAAAQALAIQLARQLHYHRVWLVWAQGQALHMLGRSDGETAGAAAAPGGAETAVQDRLLLAAAAESFDQSASVAWPPPLPEVSATPRNRAGTPRITRSHAALVRAIGPAVDTPTASTTAGPASAGFGPGGAASVPLVVEGRLVGVLCVHRTAGGAISLRELHQLEHLACLSAPLLWLMKRNERKSLQRLRDGLADAWLRAGTQRKPQLQLLGLAAGAALLAALLLPWPAQVGGRARLEGAVQRVLAAPADGFVQQVHARAGDSVRAGQPLLELADQDLQLERQRWQSQLAQHLDALSSAQARADRSQLVLHQSRADEAQAQLALTEERLQRSRLVAPFDAVVVQGDWSQQLGAPVKEGAELLTLAPLGRFRVIVEVDERDVSALKADGTAASQGLLTLSALPWDTLPLRVTRVSPLAKPVEGRNVFEVEAELQPVASSTLAGLRPGLQGMAQLEAAPASPLLHLLRRALGAARVAWWEWWG